MDQQISFRRINGRVVPIRKDSGKRPDNSGVGVQSARTGLNIARSAGAGATVGGVIYGAGFRTKKALDARITKNIRSLDNIKKTMGPKPKFSRPKPLHEWVDDTPLARRSGATKKSVAAEFRRFEAARESHLRKLDVWNDMSRRASHIKGQTGQLRVYSSFLNKKLVKTAVRGGGAAAAVSFGYLTYTQIRDALKRRKK